MRFGVREICDVVFKATAPVTIGNTEFAKGQPVLYIDTAKTSTVEGAATTVYATGGKGNARLLAWEGEKTLTFTVEDALLSPTGFAVLSGAGLMEAGSDNEIQVHTTLEVQVETLVDGGTGDYVVKIKGSDLGLADAETATLYVTEDTPIYGTLIDLSGTVVDVLGAAATPAGLELTGATDELVLSFPDADPSQVFEAGEVVRLDFYVTKTGGVTQLEIDAENFAGYYYVEAATLFRDQTTGLDFPAEFILPKVKIQSNFTFTMAASGDPSTFTFTMDAFPGATPFNPTKKVLCAIQMITGDVAEG